MAKAALVQNTQSQNIGVWGVSNRQDREMREYTPNRRARGSREFVSGYGELVRVVYRYIVGLRQPPPPSPGQRNNIRGNARGNKGPAIVAGF